MDAWTEEEASGAAAGGRTSVRPVVHAQVCEGKADAKLRRAGCNFHFFVHDKFDCRLFFLYALVNGMRMNSISFELFLHLCWLGNEWHLVNLAHHQFRSIQSLPTDPHFAS